MPSADDGISCSDVTGLRTSRALSVAGSLLDCCSLKSSKITVEILPNQVERTLKVKVKVAKFAFLMVNLL